jgi:Rrf2 family transcriptional regulator, iron-sulfur cluster assembly transcription factor
MMCLSHTAGYAIQALSLVARSGGRLCLIREIARGSGIPKPYLAKIVNQLAREGLITAKRGYRGGIYLNRPPREITLLDVVEAIDGKEFIAECMLGLTSCSAPCGCPTYKIWNRVREEVRAALRQTTLAHILEAGGSHAKRLPGKKQTAAIALGRKCRITSTQVVAKVRPTSKTGATIYEYYD